jgi:hypothetical protein
MSLLFLFVFFIGLHPPFGHLSLIAFFKTAFFFKTVFFFGRIFFFFNYLTFFFKAFLTFLGDFFLFLGVGGLLFFTVFLTVFLTGLDLGNAG